MAFNAGALSLSAQASGAISGIIVQAKDVGIQPKNPKPRGALGLIADFVLNQPPSFFFHYRGEDSVQLQSDITDFWVEDNSPVQDHIALKPEIITVQGFIGELNNVPPQIFSPFGLNIAEKVTLLSAFRPGLSATATRTINRASQVYSAANKVASSIVSAIGAFAGGPTSAQSNAFQKFYGYWKNRTLFTVQTPWNVFDNMAILSLKAIQSEETRMISDFEIQFKKINFVEVKTLTASEVAKKQLGYQQWNERNSDQVDNGVTAGTTSASSFASKSQQAYPAALPQ